MAHRFTISYLIRLIEKSGLHRWGRWEHIAYYTEKTARVSLLIYYNIYNSMTFKFLSAIKL